MTQEQADSEYKAGVRRGAMALIKNTVGYNEAVDKAVYIAAAEVAIDKTFVVMSRHIDNLEQMHRSANILYQEAVTDLRSMSNIIFKYRGN